MALRPTLETIAADLAHTWNGEAEELFAALGGAPGEPGSAVLARMTDAQLADVASPQLEARASDVLDHLRANASGPGWWHARHAEAAGFLCAYFSAEFGVADALPIFAGGLGVLAGDHLKAASDLRVPLVGVGLWYAGGYFQQGVNADGWQTEAYPRADPALLPVTEAQSAAGEPLRVIVELPGERVVARAWKVQVGAVALYLLDCDLDENSPTGRRITSALYAGDRELRVRQELVLGVGGVRALRALGLEPTVFHMNEGHSAFLALERARELVAAGAEPQQALSEVRGSTVFTTHTPVLAGNEVFDRGLVEQHVETLVGEPLARAFLRLGDIPGDAARFGMTPLALRTSAHANGVSRLHGVVAREMWAGLSGAEPVEPAAIGHVTNGVHPGTWLAPELAGLLAEAGVDPAAPPDEANWEEAASLPDEALWALHQTRKRELLDVVRARSGAELDADALTIGFARRFATYKRATLLFSLAERLRRLLGDPERPVQILLAGKAHPEDEAGKALIQQVLRIAADPASHGRVVFLTGYDIGLARRLVQGCDVWLNTPRRPQEASGTSGMKAALNGVLNASVLDGWWDEAYAAGLGFAVGGREPAVDDPAQDAADAEALHTVLADEVVPRYFDRDADGLPRAWLGMMRAAIAATGAGFSSQRMVVDYVERYYLLAHGVSVAASAG